jgi:nitrite reductase/ring-hydroxylating ferredoxin subunit
MAGEASAKMLTRLCRTDEVTPDTPLRVETGDEAYAVFQADDGYFVTADLCSHGPGSLAEGYLDGHEIECPFHQGRFDIRSGAPTAAPCFVPVRVWTPQVVNGELFIECE